jgi:fibronectin-binding autotransporter adhesin
MKPQSSLHHSLLLTACSAMVAVSSVSAQTTYTWDITPGTIGAGDSAITGGSGTWNSSNGNWTTDAGANNLAWDNTSPSVNTALFNASGINGTRSVTLGETINLKALTFSNLRNSGPVQKYTITGGTLAFSSGATITTGTTLDNVNDAEYAYINSAITGAPNVSLSWTGGNNRLVFAPASGSQALGTVTGTGNVKLAGSTTGNTIVGLNSSSSGKIRVSSGTWTLTGTATGYEHWIEGGTLIISTGTLQNNNRSTNLSGGTLHWNNAGAIRDTNINTLRDRDFNITGGNIDQTSGAPITTSTYNPQILWGGNWTFIGSNGANSNLNMGTGDVFITGATRQVTVTNAAATLTVGGTIAGTGFGLTKAGAGTLELRGAGTYTGVTTISAGTLRFAKQVSLYNNTPASWTAANINVKNSGTIALNVGGTGEFTTGDVTTLLTNLAASSSGTNGMNAGSNFGFDTTNASGGTFTLADVIADSTGASGGARGVTKLGTGELVLTNTNTHTGTTTVKAGTLTLGHATDTLGSSSPVTVDGSGATLAIGSNSDTVGMVTLKSGSITGTGGTLTGSSFAMESGSVSAILGGGGTLTKTTGGTVILSGANSFSGAINVTSGTLQLSGAAASIASSSGVDLGGGTLLISNTSALNNTDRLNNSGTVTFSGGGVLNFAHTGGAANYSETTGALSVTGSGNQIITSRADSGQTSTLTFASLTLGGGLQFTGDALGLDSRNRIFITAQSAGPIGGSATYFDPLNNVTTPAAYTLLNGVGPQAADVDVDVLGGVIPDGSAAVSIIQAGTSGNITLGSPVTSIDSLTQTASQAGTLELAGEILRTDLVIIGNSNAPLTIGSTSGEGTITPKTTSGSLTLNNNYAAPLLIVNSVIANNGSGSSLLKTGAGTVQVTAGATYTGATVIGAGTLTLTGAGTLPDASAVDLSDPSSVLHLAGISSPAETIGALTGVTGSSVVLGGKTLGINGVSPAPFAGVISGSGGGLTLLAGASQTLTGDNTFTGDVTIGAGGTLSVNQIETAGAQPLGQGTTPIIMQGNIGSGSTLTYTSAGAGATNRGLSLTGGQGGTVNVAAGTLAVNGTLSGSANFHKAGAGTLLLSGGSTWSANGFVNDGTLVLGGDSSPGSNSLSAGNWTVATGATMRLNTTGALETPTLTRNGTFNLEAGTLRTNAIAGSGSFVWGAGTIAPLSNLTEGLTDRTDPGGSPSGPVVREGTILDYSGNLATSNGSTLDLGGLFTDNGLRYNQINISGALSLAAADELKININPYLLRPNTYTSTITGDWGTLRLVMADSITGSFDTITGIGTDYLGFTADPGSGATDSFINPASLAMNTYYIEYRTSGVLSGAAVLFHYKVAGSVPEPGSAGLLLGGVVLLRAMRRVSGRARFAREPGESRSSGLRRRRSRRASLHY